MNQHTPQDTEQEVRTILAAHFYDTSWDGQVAELLAWRAAAVASVRAAAYADCASKGGSATEVRAYARARANGYNALHQQQTNSQLRREVGK